MLDLNPTPVKFSKPPIVEVVCGIQFQSMQPLKSAHFGKYWDSIKTEFPITDDAPPIFGSAPFEAMAVPPLRRAWFLSAGGEYIIQVQSDRFLFNWKREVRSQSPYPSFELVYGEFRERLESFLRFLEENLEGVRVTGLDLTYVNIVHSGNGLSSHAPWDVLVSTRPNYDERLFLPRLSDFGWSASYVIPDLGNLRVSANTMQMPSDSEKVLRVELSVIGGGASETAGDRDIWFEKAHACITHGFVDVTSKQIQQEFWGREQ